MSERNYPAITHWLRNNSLEDLASRYSVSVKCHPRHPHLIHLNYDQFETPKDQDFLRDCRSIILDASDNFAPVAWPFARFCNIGEEWGLPPLDSEIVAWEKLDGSMMIMWHYDRTWHVSTRGTMDANTPLYEHPNSGVTYADMFWKIIQSEEYRHIDWDKYKDFTLCFEFVSPLNRIVVEYDTSEVRLIAMRNRLTGEEIDIWYNTDFKIPKFVKIKSVEQARDLIEAIPAVEQEGWVIVDKNFNRRKLKSLEYLTYHRVRTMFSVRGIIDLWMRGDDVEEFLAYFPDFRSKVDSIIGAIDAFAAEAENCYQSLPTFDRRIDFVNAVRDSKFKSYCFGRLDGKYANFRGMATVKNKSGEFMWSARKVQEYVGINDAILPGSE